MKGAIDDPVASVYLREDGILVFQYKPLVYVTLDDAIRLVEIGGELGGRPVPTLINVGDVGGASREARVFFSKDPRNQQTSSCIAMLVGSPLAKMIANFFMGINRPIMPIRTFTDEDKALEWLRTVA